MPLIDKPLDELRTYAGRNPYPADMDAYWDEALAEMAAVDPAVELRPAAFQSPFAECFDLLPGGAPVPRLQRQLGRVAG